MRRDCALFIVFHGRGFVKPALLESLHCLKMVLFRDSATVRGVFSIGNFYILYMLFNKLGFRQLSVSAAIAFVLAAPACFPQAAASPNQPNPAVAKASDLLHPALSQISQTVVALNISRWKAPNEVRSATQQNIDSIQRDLNNTLPGLLAAADAAPEAVSAVFPVYRNIDALYDVLLRVSQTANLAASQKEATDITGALERLESARADLGNAILNASKNNEAEMMKLRTAIQQEAAAKAAAPPKTTVVNDGPAPSTSTTKRKKKPATKPATPAQPPQ